MTTTINPSTELVGSVEPLFTEAERTALMGFLAGYSGLTRDA
jgi:integrase/recombinase XerD